MALKGLTVSFILAARFCGAAPVYYLETSHSGPQTQIDLAHTSTWMFTPNVAFELAGGLFQMKDGANTLSTVTLSVFKGIDATLLGFVSLTHAEFCAQVDNCGQFGYHLFSFNPIQLAKGTGYFATLTSTAPDSQKEAYFIKSNTMISDVLGNAIEPQPIGPLENAPEPHAFVLIGLGLAVCVSIHRRAFFKRSTPCLVSPTSAGDRLKTPSKGQPGIGGTD